MRRRDRNSTPITTLPTQTGRAGANLQLTIDSALQNFVQARLGEESASAVVMDIEHGDILAIGSAPTFDPNKFVRGISVADYSALTENEYRPRTPKNVPRNTRESRPTV